jgi:uncharacterized Zn-finger protein
MSPSIPTITCPYCGYVFLGVKVVRHGPVNCSKCGRTFRI